MREIRPRHALLLLQALCLTGCAICDPSCAGIAPPSPYQSWIGCPTPERILREADEESRSTVPPPGRKLNGPDIVDIALSNNPLTQTTWYSARSNAFAYLSSQGSLYPTITYDATLAVSNSGGGQGAFTSVTPTNGGAGGEDISIDTAGLTGVQTTLLHELTLNYLLFDFGGRDAAIESARQALIASNWAHDREIQTVIVQALTNYYNYLTQRALVEARKEDLNDTKKTLDAAQKQFDVGVVAKIDVLQASANHAAAEYALEAQYSSRDISMAQLATSMGLQADNVLDIGEPPMDVLEEKVTSDAEELLWIAKHQRPDYKESYASFVRGWADLQAVWSAGMPSFVGSFTYDKFVNIHNPSTNSWAWQGQISLNVPVFTGFSDYYNTRSAEETLGVLWAQYRNNELTIMLDVMTSYYNYKSASVNLKNSDEFYKFSKEAYDVAYASYRGGVATILDVLNAQTKLATARSLRIQARTNIAVSLASLAYSTGVLYK